MQLSAPRFFTWLVAVIVGGAGILQHFHILNLGFLSPYTFWMVTIGFGLLVLATVFKKL